jgi:hypothetical protein
LNDKLKEFKKGKNVDVCLTSVTFARFTIDKTGNVDSLSFYEFPQTPVVFREILTSMIKASSGNWVPRTINGKAVESKPFILPLVYEMEAGCYLSGKVVHNGTNNALQGLLGYIDVFKDPDPNILQLDCILLRPLVISSYN